MRDRLAAQIRRDMQLEQLLVAVARPRRYRAIAPLAGMVEPLPKALIQLLGTSVGMTLIHSADCGRPWRTDLAVMWR